MTTLLAEHRAHGPAMSVNTCNIASFAVPVKVTYSRAHAHIHTCTKTHLPHCQSKLGACSLNPIYESPIVFLDVLSDMGRKGQNSSTHHPWDWRGKKKVFETERERWRWTERTKKTERLKLPGRHKKDIEEILRRRRRGKHQAERGIDCMPWTQLLSLPPNTPTFPTSASCHSRADDNPHPVSTIRHLNHTGAWYCHQALSGTSHYYIATCAHVCFCEDRIG